MWIAGTINMYIIVHINGSYDYYDMTIICDFSNEKWDTVSHIHSHTLRTKHQLYQTFVSVRLYITSWSIHTYIHRPTYIRKYIHTSIYITHTHTQADNAFYLIPYKSKIILLSIYQNSFYIIFFKLPTYCSI